MRKHHLCMIAAVLLMALMSFGCSNHNPATPQLVENHSPGDDGLKDDTTYYHTIQGWVVDWDGFPPDAGKKVYIQEATFADYVLNIWGTLPEVAVTDENGYFVRNDIVLDTGFMYRCLSLSVYSAAQSWNGTSTALTFYIQGEKIIKDPIHRVRI